MKYTAACLLAFVIFASGCGDRELEDMTGKACVVQFRRGDALGSAAANPVPPMTSSINGAETSVEGKLISCDKEWIVIQPKNSGEIWVPRSSVLLISFSKS